MFIRSDQVQAFAKFAEEIFVAEASAYLVEQHGRKKVSLPNGVSEIRSLLPLQLNRMVRVGVRRAGYFGLISRSSLMSFLVTMFLTAPNFDEYPLVRSILEDRSLEPELRMKLLWKRTSDPDWVSIRHMYNPKAWERLSEDMASE